MSSMSRTYSGNKWFYKKRVNNRAIIYVTISVADNELHSGVNKMPTTAVIDTVKGVSCLLNTCSCVYKNGIFFIQFITFSRQ